MKLLLKNFVLARRVPRLPDATRIVVAAFLLPLLCLLGPSPLIGQVGSPEWDQAVAAFGERLSKDVKADDVGGIAAGIVVAGDLVWAKGFGWADRNAHTAMTPGAVSRTGSISKSVTALLMMRLVDQGIIGLDEPVERYLPSFAQVAGARAGAPIVTFRHLASHTAGLVREPGNGMAAMSGPIELWQKRLIEALGFTRYDSVPGARYQYSNIGFGVLGLALSRAAGRPFIELVEQEVFQPLGMVGSAFVVVGGALEPRLAAGYANTARGEIDSITPMREHRGRGYKVPNGGVYSTVADLGRVLGAIAGVPGLQILSEEARSEMTSVQTPEDPSNGYGLGLMIQSLEDGRTIVGHSGSVAGYTAYMAVDLGSSIGVALLRNYARGETDLRAAAFELVEQLSAMAAQPTGQR